MKNSYRDAMDALRFTPEQKEQMVEHLLSAPAAGKVVRPLRPLRFRRFAAAGAAAALVLSLGVAGATGALGSAGEAFAGLFGGGAAETEIIDQIGYPIGASATSNGVTITADAIVGDTYSYHRGRHLQLRHRLLHPAGRRGAPGEPGGAGERG